MTQPPAPSRLAPTPDTQPHPGVGANLEPGHGRVTIGQALLDRAGDDYFRWLDHIWPAAGCANPIRLHGDLLTLDTRTGEVLHTLSTEELPDRIIYKACGNRRANACPSCAETYRRDAYHLIRAGLAGGKGVPESVGTHPAVFATFTAPSFGEVHTRYVRRHTCTVREHCRCRPEPCHARRDLPLCPHDAALACFTRHRPDDPALGQPLCCDCYDYPGHVVWNHTAGRLWHRTKRAIERHLSQLARRRGLPPVRVAHGKAAEYQRRGIVHFHVLLRLDGTDPDDQDAIVSPPPGFTAADLDDALHHAVRTVTVTTPRHPDHPAGWLVTWGGQVDIRMIGLRGSDPLTDRMVAGYLAKYATKGTETTGHTSRRLTPDTLDIYADPAGTHTERLIHACWHLGRHKRYEGLRRWAHMLGFGGHFLSKARRWSLTFRLLRDARILYWRTETAGPDYGHIRTADHTGEDTTLIVGQLSYVGTGWRTIADAYLANTAAARAREQRAVAREQATDPEPMKGVIVTP